MSNFTAVYDACVLYPAQLRDLLVRLGMTGHFKAKWSEEIHEEWIRSLVETRGINREKLQRTRELMDKAVRDCLVTGYDDLVAGLSLPDPNDRHVLAAAIRCGADVIVTYNLKDFPRDSLDLFGIEAQHPDEFVNHLLGLVPQDVCAVVKRQRESLEKPPLTVEDLLAAFERCGLAQTVASLRGYVELL